MPVRIIAEIGVNHNNDMATARAMILSAQQCGADMVKMQASTISEEVSTRHAPEHAIMLSQVVPNFDFIRQCADYASAIDLPFLCTPAGEESLDFVVSLGVPAIKVASDNLTNIPFLQAVARTQLPVILSTGMGTLEEIKMADMVLASRQRRLTLLHCVSAYPCPDDGANLGALIWMKQQFTGAIIGYSDHTTSELIPAAAVAMGALVIEKHLTLDRNMPGPDHAASLEPDQFARMVRNIRTVEAAFSTRSAEIAAHAQGENARLYRKSLVAKAPIAMGELLTPDNVTAKRPGTGIPVSRWNSVMGTVAQRDFAPDELIEQ